MGRFDGMKGLVLGVANDHSLAWAIAKEILAGGGQIGFSHLPDRPDDERQRNRRRVAQLTDPEPNAKFLVPMDVSSDEQIAAVNAVLAEIGAADIPQILVYNKIDLSGDVARVERDEYGKICAIRLSAQTGAGLDLLRSTLEASAAATRVPVASSAAA